MEQLNLDIFLELLTKLRDGIITSSNDVTNLFKLEKMADDMDQAVADNSAALASKLYFRQATFLKRIEASLKKIEDGTYGECICCGAEISIKRLLARPTALLCIYCKEEQESVEQKEKDKLKGGFLADME